MANIPATSNYVFDDHRKPLIEQGNLIAGEIRAADSDIELLEKSYELQTLIEGMFGRPGDRGEVEGERVTLIYWISVLRLAAEGFGDGKSITIPDTELDSEDGPRYEDALDPDPNTDEEKTVNFSRSHLNLRTFSILAHIEEDDRSELYEQLDPLALSLDFDGSLKETDAVHALRKLYSGSDEEDTREMMEEIIISWLQKGLRSRHGVSSVIGMAEGNVEVLDLGAAALIPNLDPNKPPDVGLIGDLAVSSSGGKIIDLAIDAVTDTEARPIEEIGEMQLGPLNYAAGMFRRDAGEVGKDFTSAQKKDLAAVFAADDSVLSRLALGLLAFDESPSLKRTFVENFEKKIAFWSNLKSQYGATPEEVEERSEGASVLVNDLLYAGFIPTGEIKNPDELRAHLNKMVLKMSDDTPRALMMKRFQLEGTIQRKTARGVLNNFTAQSLVWRLDRSPELADYFDLAATELVRSRIPEDGPLDRGRREYGVESYFYPFYFERITPYKGEPKEKPRDGIDAELQAFRYPKSEFARAQTKEMILELREDRDRLSLHLQELIPLAGTKGTFIESPEHIALLGDIIDGKLLVEREEFPGQYSVERENSDNGVMAAYLLMRIAGSDLGATLVAEHVEKYYLHDSPGLEPARFWGIGLEALLEIDPRHPHLDLLTARMREPQHVGGEFAAWVLDLRRGVVELPPFPAKSYYRCWFVNDFHHVVLGLARAGAAAGPHLDSLRDPKVLGHHVTLDYYDSSDGRPVRSFECLHLLGALDRIEWLHRGLPPQMDRVM